MYAGRLSNTTMNSVDDMGSNLRFCFSFFVSVPFIIFALLFSLPPSRNSDPGSHSRLFSPLTHYGSCLAFLSREDFSPFFPRRLASTCAYPRYALSAVDPYLFIFFFASKFIISPRRDSNSRTSTSSIRGLPLVHRGDRLYGPFYLQMTSTVESDY